jgi:hypothetical protein
MQLPFFKNRLTAGQQRDYLFAVQIDPTLVKTSVWTVANDKVQVLAVGLLSKWDAQTSESLISACDESLSDATKKLDPTGKVQPEQVILGLSSDWLVEDKIAPERLKLLKSLSRELSLKPIGFVITSEALVRYLHLLEGVPPTAIIVGIKPDRLEVTLVRLGKMAGIEIVHRSDNVGQDLAEGLSRFKSENMLPSRMLIYGPGQNLETSRQEILTFAWQAPQYHLPFLHFPKVEILPDDFSIQAISQSGGGEVAKAIGLISTPVADTPVSDQELLPASTPTELGFFPDVDVADSPEIVNPEPPPDVPLSASPPPISRPRIKFHLALPVFNFKFKFPHFNFPKTAVFIIPLVILLLGGLIWFFWQKLSAEVTLTLAPETRDYSLEFTADPQTSQIDSSVGSLPAAQVSVTVSESKSKTTTGSKIIGDKAIGEVTIINGTAVPRLLPAGTVLTSPSGLKFTLDASVEVASASGTADPNSYQPGKTTAKITASVIGSDSNLSAGTQFRIGSFSSLDYVAKNDAAFTGGSSRQVQAVSQKDITDLRSELTAALTETAKSRLVAEQDSSRIVIPDSVTAKVDKESLDHQVDEAADQVSLEITLKATGISIARTDLESLVSDKISSETPADFYQYQPMDYEFGIKSSSGDKAKVSVNATTHLLPRMDYDQVKNTLKGKSFSDAEKYLRSLRGVTDVSLNTLPKIFSWVRFLPHVTQNIKFIANPS